MKKYESIHYIFHYNENSKAEKDIDKIVRCQESCFEHICNVLRVFPTFKIEYFLCNSPEEVGSIYGDNEPCSGFAVSPNTIYAVYNDELQCIGFHEDAHIISYLINTPECSAIREGLAMYFDRKWWGISNLDWVAYFIKNKEYVKIEQLLDDDVFFSMDCSITYPIVGAFTDWIISTYGIEKYLMLYNQKETVTSFQTVYGWEINELNQQFIDYVSLFVVDSVLENRMNELLR